MRASRTSIHDRRFTCCIEILGDNRLAWATRTLNAKIGLPAVLEATGFFISNVVDQQAHCSLPDDEFNPSLFAAFFFQTPFLFLKKERNAE